MEYNGTFLEHFARQPAHLQARYVVALLELLALRTDVSQSARDRIRTASASAGAVHAQLSFDAADEPRAAA